jgi:hypothetical protein
VIYSQVSFSIGITDVGKLSLDRFVPKVQDARPTETICSIDRQASLSFIRILKDQYFPSEDDSFFLSKIILGKCTGEKLFDIAINDLVGYKLGDKFSENDLIKNGYKLINSSSKKLSYFKEVIEDANVYSPDLNGETKRIDIHVWLKNNMIIKMSYEEMFFN